MLYNARKNYEKAQEIPIPKDGQVSRQAINLYDEVIKKCEMVIATYPTSKWVDDAILLMGKAFYEQGKYDEAIVKFMELEEAFPESELNEEAIFYIGRSYLMKDDEERAIRTFSRFIDRYQKSKFNNCLVLLISG